MSSIFCLFVWFVMLYHCSVFVKCFVIVLFLTCLYNLVYRTLFILSCHDDELYLIARF